MHPVLLHIGHITFYSFGLMAALSLLVPGFLVIYPLLKRHGVRFADRLVLEVIIAAGVGGFAGARIYYLFQHLSDVRHDVWGSIFTGSGFTWYGGLIGGIVAVAAICLVRRAPLGLMANIVAPSVALGYAIGRVGCQLAGDGDYGKPSGLPWAMGYPHGTVPTPPGVRVHPTPIYEILLMLPIFWVLWRLARKPRPGWYVFGWFLVLSGLERFPIEFLRRNPHWLLGLTQPQWIAMLSVVIGTVMILVTRHREPVPNTGSVKQPSG